MIDSIVKKLRDEIVAEQPRLSVSSQDYILGVRLSVHLRDVVEDCAAIAEQYPHDAAAARIRRKYLGAK